MAQLILEWEANFRLTFRRVGMLTGIFEGDTLQVRKDLLAYCKMDTMAMVEIYRKVKGVCS